MNLELDDKNKQQDKPCHGSKYQPRSIGSGNSSHKTFLHFYFWLHFPKPSSKITLDS